MDSVRLRHIIVLAATLVVATGANALAQGSSGLDLGAAAEGACTPVIGVNPNPLDFGEVPVGNTSTLTFTISNETTSGPDCLLEVTAIDFQNGQPTFDFVGDPPIVPFTLSDTETRDVEIVFAPASPTTFTGNIIIESTDPDAPSVTLELTGSGGPPEGPPTCDAGGPYAGAVDATITFDGSGSNDPDGTIVSWDWDFGDGASGSGETTTHAYSGAGTYTVTLTVTDDDDLSSSCSTTANITEAAESITVTAPAGGEDFDPGEITTITWTSEGDITTVDILLSTDGGGTFTEVLVDEPNDGSVEWTVQNLPSDAAVIRVRKVGGATFGDSGQFAISGLALTSPNGGESFQIDATETIAWTSFGGNVTAVTIELSRDGGSVFETLAASETNDGAFDWTVTGPATDQALVRISDADNALAEDTSDEVFTITSLTPPVCDAGGPYTGEVDAAVAFDGSGSSDSDGTIESWDWDFGDGASGSGETTSHTYTSAGTYTVTLTVTDDDALSSSCSTTAEIAGGPEEPLCDNGGPYNGQPNVALNFDGSGSSDPDGSIVSWDWEFGDGASGSGETTTHAYTATGSYTVTLTVTDDDGLSSSCATTADIADNLPPTCDAGGPYEGVVDEPVTFDGTGSSDPDGEIVLYEWEFADGGGGPGAIVEHTFDELGTFPVTLTVTDDGGESSTCETTVTIGLPEGTVAVALPPRMYGRAGQDVVIPVFLQDDVTGLGILSAEIEVVYDRLLLDFRGVNLTGTIGDGGVFESNVVDLGPRRSRANISIAWATPLEDCETFANLLFEGQSDGITQAPVELDVVFNEGDPHAFPQGGTYFLGMLGDVNGSGNVSAIDASLVLQETVGLIRLPDPDFPDFKLVIADVSGNDAISALDASLILRFVLGLIDAFPAADLLECVEPFAGSMSTAGRQTPRAASLVANVDRLPGTVEVTLGLDQLAGVYGSEFDLTYDPRVLRAVEVTPLWTGSDVLSASRIDDGRVELSLAAATPGEGSAELARVRFIRLTSDATTVGFARSELNEGALGVEGRSVSIPSGVVAAALDDTVGVAVPRRVYGARGGDAVIPLFLQDDVTDLDVFSAEIAVQYRPSVLDVVGVDLTGTIGEDGVAELNIVELGPDRHEARVSIAWVEALEGCEEFAKLLVQVNNERPESYLEIEAVLNEGVPAVRTSDGRFIVGVLGDVNASGQVTALDASLVLQAVVGQIELPDPEYPDLRVDIADVSGNDEIRAFDAALILQYVLGLIDSFPAEKLLTCGDLEGLAGTPERPRWLELVEVARGDGWVELDLVVDDIAGVLGAEVLLEVPGAGRVTVENLLGAHAIAAAERRGHDRLMVAVAAAEPGSGAATIARLRIEGLAAGDPGVALIEAALNEGRLPVTLKGGGVLGAVLRYRLLQNVPNPFNPSTELRFETGDAGAVRLAVYDAAGRLVRLLVDGQVEAGPHVARWDGTDALGRPVSAGVYFYTLEASGFTETRKMILLK